MPRLAQLDAPDVLLYNMNHPGAMKSVPPVFDNQFSGTR